MLSPVVRTGLQLLGLLALAFVPLNLLAADSKPAAKQNVVLIVVDDQGFQAGCYGDKVVKTPNLDYLASQATRFTRACCTTASCSPSRSVILTGMHNHANGQYGLAHTVHHFRTHEKVRSLPLLLGAAGYRTCSIGKMHVEPEAVYHFETYRNRGTQGHRNSVRMAKNAHEWLAEKDDRPFFLYYCSSDPHRARDASGFANFNEKPGHYPGVVPVKYRPEDIPVPAWLPDRPEVRGELAEYYQAISRLDQGLGLLFDALKETGHWEDTLIVFLSDNGPPFPGAKTTLYQPGMQLPLIVRSPRQKSQGIVSNARVSWVDIAPTILDFCGVDYPLSDASKPVPLVEDIPVHITEMQGRSFLPILDEAAPTGWDTLYGSHTFHESTMYYPVRVKIQGKYKYIHNLAHQLPFPFASDLFESKSWQSTIQNHARLYGKRTVDAYIHRPVEELYDLEADPDELHNLATVEGHQKRLQDFRTQMQAWQRATYDPWSVKQIHE